jgi:hypothetical protein
MYALLQAWLPPASLVESLHYGLALHKLPAGKRLPPIYVQSLLLPEHPLLLAVLAQLLALYTGQPLYSFYCMSASPVRCQATRSSLLCDSFRTLVRLSCSMSSLSARLTASSAFCL